MTATNRLAEFTVKTQLADCPTEALAAMRRAALDTIGVILAGVTEPSASLIPEARPAFSFWQAARTAAPEVAAPNEPPEPSVGG